MSNFSTWEKFPFTVDGVEFVSLLDPNGKMYKQVTKLPSGIFTMMNQDAIQSLIGNVSIMTRLEIQEELDKVNEGYIEAYVALV